MTEQTIKITNIETGEVFTTPKVLEHNLETDTIIERDFNQDETTAYLLELQAEKDRQDAESIKAEQRQSAMTKLAALGLTADDLKALGL